MAGYPWYLRHPIYSTMSSTTDSHTETFAEGAGRLLAKLQAEFRVIVAAVPGAERPADLQRALGINPKLAWQAVRAASAETPLDVAAFIPAHVSVGRIANSLEQLGLDGSRLLAASEELHEFIATHAGGRATFDTMVSSLAGADASRAQADMKRAAFRAMSQIYGGHTETRLNCLIFRPGSRPRHGHLAELRFIERFWRTRADASLVISRRRLSVNHEGGRTPIDPESEFESVPFIGRDLSAAPPPLRNVELADGTVETQLASEDMGRGSAFSCVLGTMATDVSAAMDDTGLFWIDAQTVIWTPSRLLIMDVLIHEEMFDGDLPELVVKSSSARDGVWPTQGSSDLLPIQETVSRLRTPAVLHAAGVPKYRETVTGVFDKLGWDDLDSFRHFRCQAEYPVQNSRLWMRFDCSDWLERQGCKVR